MSDKNRKRKALLRKKAEIIQNGSKPFGFEPSVFSVMLI